MGKFKRSQEQKGAIARHQAVELDYDQTYRCPACGSGQISAITLMDVFACDFCRHIFTANLQTQSVQLADSTQPRAWYWSGGQWRTAYQRDTSAYLVWIFCSGLTAVPVTMIALSNYVFPPLESSDFPLMWTGLTLLFHVLMAGWLLAEYHRWPWYIANRVRWQRWRERWATDS